MGITLANCYKQQQQTKKPRTRKANKIDDTVNLLQKQWRNEEKLPTTKAAAATSSSSPSPTNSHKTRLTNFPRKKSLSKLFCWWGWMMVLEGVCWWTITADTASHAWKFCRKMFISVLDMSFSCSSCWWQMKGGSGMLHCREL